MRQGYREEQVRETMATGMTTDFRDTNIETFVVDRSMQYGALAYGDGKKMMHSVGSKKPLGHW